MRELIEQIIRDYDLPLSKQYHDEYCDFESTVIDAFLDFGKQVCELQKQKCADKATWFAVSDFAADRLSKNDCAVNKESILNCKNVCTT